MAFYQITALYMGTEEIAYAEGEDYPEVMRECVEQIPALYVQNGQIQTYGLYPAEDVTLKAVADSGVIREVATPLECWLMLQD